MEKSKKNKIIVVLLSIFACIFAIGGVVTAFILNYNTYSPNPVEILDDGKNIYLYIEMNDNYSKYRLKFNSDGSEEIVIDSDNNIISLENLMQKGVKLGQAYTITSCYLSDNEGNNSQYSEPITWTFYQYLSSPEIIYIEEDNVIAWEEIENASYYRVFYSGDEELTSFKTEDNYYDLSLLSGKERLFYVVAYSDKDYYKQSSQSNCLEIQVVHHFIDFVSASLDSKTKILTIIGKEKLSKIFVYLENIQYDVVDFNVVYDEQENQYVYTIDLTVILNQNKEIYVSPASIDEYNIFTGGMIQVDII